MLLLNNLMVFNQFYFIGFGIKLLKNELFKYIVKIILIIYRIIIFSNK